MDIIDESKNGFYTFRVGFPQYSKKSVFFDKCEIITDGYGKIMGVTNPDKLSFLILPPTFEGIQITEIAPSAFKECINLKRVELPETIEEIGEKAFSHTSIENIKLPSTLYKIGEEAFSYTYLETFVLPLGIKEVPKHLLANSSSLKNVFLPDTITKINTMAFAFCESLVSINLGRNLLEIGDGAFMGTGIKSITLPHTLRCIGLFAFSRCCNLEAIYYDGSARDFRSISFGEDWHKGIREDCALYLKDERGNYYNAFSSLDESEREKEEEEKRKNLKILGLKEMPKTEEELHKVYRTLVLRFHPDRLSGLNLPPEYSEFAKEKFDELTSAYMALSVLY